MPRGAEKRRGVPRRESPTGIPDGKPSPTGIPDGKPRRETIPDGNPRRETATGNPDGNLRRESSTGTFNLVPITPKLIYDGCGVRACAQEACEIATAQCVP